MAENILIEKSYSNWAWRFIYEGYIVYGDGNIYSFSTNDKDTYQEITQNMDLYISQHGILEDQQIAADDLQKMLTYIGYIDPSKQSDKITGGYDMGQESIFIYEPADQSRILLKESGDVRSHNTSDYAPELIELIEKYFPDKFAELGFD